MNTKFITLLFILSLHIVSLSQSRSLDYFIKSGVSNNPMASEYNNNILIAGIDSSLIVAAGRYRVSANGNAYYAPVARGFGYDKAITNGQQLSALIALNKQLYNKRNLSLQFADIQIQKDSLQNNAAISQYDLKRNIITQYITVYSEQLQISFNDELQAVLQKQQTILKKLTQKNVYRQVDYLSFLVTVQQQNLARQQLEIQHKIDYSLLYYLAGLNDTAALKLEKPSLAFIEKSITYSSTFFIKYKIDSLRLANNRAIIDLDYLPKVSLFADAGYQSSFAITPYKNFGANIGINLTIPIYDGKQRRLQYTKINIRERTLQKNRIFFNRQYYQQIAQLQQQLSLIPGLEFSINEQVRFSETLLEANGKLLETGDIKITDYILALNNYITAKNLLIQNMISRYQVINQLNYWNN